MEEGQINDTNNKKRERKPVLKTKLTRAKKDEPRRFIDLVTGVIFDLGVLGLITDKRYGVFYNLPVYKRFLEQHVDEKKRAKFFEEACGRVGQIPDTVPIAHDPACRTDEASNWLQEFAVWHSINDVTVERWLAMKPAAKKREKKSSDSEDGAAGDEEQGSAKKRARKSKKATKKADVVLASGVYLVRKEQAHPILLPRPDEHERGTIDGLDAFKRFSKDGADSEQEIAVINTDSFYLQYYPGDDAHMAARLAGVVGTSGSALLAVKRKMKVPSAPIASASE